MSAAERNTTVPLVPSSSPAVTVFVGGVGRDGETGDSVVSVAVKLQYRHASLDLP